MSAWVHAPQDAVSEINAETGELPVLDEAHRYVYGLRRTAKQHLVAAKCPCQWEWVQVLEGQLEDRPDLDEETIAHLWELREPCPALHAEGGGADWRGFFYARAYRAAPGAGRGGVPEARDRR